MRTSVTWLLIGFAWHFTLFSLPSETQIDAKYILRTYCIITSSTFQFHDPVDRIPFQERDRANPSRTPQTISTVRSVSVKFPNNYLTPPFAVQPFYCSDEMDVLSCSTKWRGITRSALSPLLPIPHICDVMVLLIPVSTPKIDDQTVYVVQIGTLEVRQVNHSQY